MLRLRMTIAHGDNIRKEVERAADGRIASLQQPHKIFSRGRKHRRSTIETVTRRLAPARLALDLACCIETPWETQCSPYGVRSSEMSQMRLCDACKSQQAYQRISLLMVSTGKPNAFRHISDTLNFDLHAQCINFLQYITFSLWAK